ncbi:MAG: TlpA family protein disulfide reductase [Bacteroidetes bacterium]|nr:TlpA family protein disulfide reductase [Bacteroidota bacterium]
MFRKFLFTIFTYLSIFLFSSFTTSKNHINRIKPGDIAPEIALPNISNHVISLSSLKGNYIVLDFWASWCAACRKENQNLVRVYNKYKDKKLINSKTIIFYSVSLDTDPEIWQKAIKNDKLSWEYHVSSLKKWKCPAADSYGISALPAGFLIGPDGVIITDDIRSSNLESELEKILFK